VKKSELFLILHTFLFIIIGANITNASDTLQERRERRALIALYISTDGDNWKNKSRWKEAPLDNDDGFALPGTEDNWFGVSVSTNSGITAVVGIELSNNSLEGSIPLEIGDLIDLITLDLSRNKLTGSIPTEMGNLTNLSEGNLNLKYNALHTSDTTLADFLDTKQKDGNWQSTQTIPPKQFKAEIKNATIVGLSWVPIPFSYYDGEYEIYMVNSNPEKDNTLLHTTATKKVDYYTVTDLDTNNNIYTFIMRTKTEKHYFNQNTIYSEFTNEIIAKEIIPVDDSGCFIESIFCRQK